MEVATRRSEEIHMKISQKMKSTPSIPIYLKTLKATRRR
jgi:hypothetical protein